MLLWYRMQHVHFIYHRAHKTCVFGIALHIPQDRPCGGLCCLQLHTLHKLMNGCFEFTVVHEASDGWASFGLITGFTRGLRIAVNQGPHYKSCRLRRASSHPNLMSQQISPLCCLLVSWESERSAAFYCQVKLFTIFIYLFQIAAYKPIKNKFLILQQHLQCMLGFDALQHNSH